MIFIGIDPGLSGGIAVIDELGIVQPDGVVKMPPTEADLLTFLGRFSAIKEGMQPRAVLERVSSSPQMGVVSAFTFGRGVGALKMALVAESIPYDEVPPSKWQAAMSVLDKRAKGRLGKRDKNISKRRAQQLFPRVTVTHATADALLLAEYCRRTERARGGTR